MSVASDDLDIRSGGIVAVDTETLRAAAARLAAEAAECDELRGRLDRAHRLAQTHDLWVAAPAAVAAQAADRARRLSGDLQTMADTYEVAELAAAATVADAAGDLDLAAELRRRVAAILAAHPTVIAKLALASVAWRSRNPDALAAQYGVSVPFGDALTLGADKVGMGGVALALTGLVSDLGRGRVDQGTKLWGRPHPVDLTRREVARTSAPMSLTQVVDRIPEGDGRVRVERYTLPDGSRRFAAYIAGTAGVGEREPWNWTANGELYVARQEAASYTATMAALADAGARPGDSVDLFGYSQGAMVASFMAMSDTYDVPMLVTFGDPVQADVGSDTLSVAVRHADDPVSALADGGYAAGVGAEGSFVATRETPGSAWDGQGMFGAHQLDTYRDTARLLDGSPDPRMDGVRARWDDLARARSVEAFVYEASTLPPAEPPDVPAARFERSAGATPGVSYGASAGAG